jgi:hypothetical protein
VYYLLERVLASGALPNTLISPSDALGPDGARRARAPVGVRAAGAQRSATAELRTAAGALTSRGEDSGVGVKTGRSGVARTRPGAHWSKYSSSSTSSTLCLSISTASICGCAARASAASARAVPCACADAHHDRPPAPCACAGTWCSASRSSSGRRTRGPSSCCCRSRLCIIPQGTLCIGYYTYFYLFCILFVLCIASLTLCKGPRFDSRGAPEGFSHTGQGKLFGLS